MLPWQKRSETVKKKLQFQIGSENFYVSKIFLQLGDRGFESRQGLEIFLLTTASRMALGSTQLPIQWVPAALSLGVKRPWCESDHSLPSSAFMMWCSVEKSTGTTLPLPLPLEQISQMNYFWIITEKLYFHTNFSTF
jgi:hypothetical protein